MDIKSHNEIYIKILNIKYRTKIRTVPIILTTPLIANTIINLAIWCHTKHSS